MQPNLSEYIEALRKFNAGISDTEIKEYLLTVGYKPEELAGAFGRIYAEAITKKETALNLPKEVPIPTSVLTTPISILPETSPDPYRQSILTGDNFSLQSKATPLVVEKIEKVEDAPYVVIPRAEVPVEKPLQNPTSYPGMGNFNQDTQYKVPGAIGYTNPDWKEPKVKSPWVTLLVWLLVFGFAGGGAYAYMKFVHGIYLFVKPPFSRENFLEDFLAKIESVKTANQKLALTFSVTEQDPDAVAFKRTIENEELLAPYKRDEDRLRDSAFILDALTENYNTKKIYPETLSEIGLPVADAKGAPYQYKILIINKVSTPELKISFETAEALDIAKKSGAVVVGTQATFNNKIYTYLLQNRVEPKSLSGLVFFKNIEDSLKFLPVGTEASVAVSGLYEKGVGAGAENNSSSIQAELKSDLFSFEVDVDFKKIAKDFFIKVNKAPTLFIDLSKVKNKWVNITSEKIFGGEFSDFGDLKGAEKEFDIVLPQIKKIVEVAKEEGLFQLVGDITKTKESGDTLFYYKVTLSKEAYKKFYERVARELSSEYKEKSILTYDEVVLASLQSKEFDSLWDYFFGNTNITIVADKNGAPLKIELATRFVPGDASGVNAKKTAKQINLKIGLENKDINRPVTFEAPKEFLTFKEALTSVQGITSEEYDFTIQEKNLFAIGSALDSYKKLTGSYPESLDVLSLKGEEVRKQAKPDAYFALDFNEKMPLMPASLEDMFTKKPFIYKKIAATKQTPEDFTLSYMIKIPAYDKSGVNPFELRGQKIGLKYIQGINTANGTTLSVEAEKDFALDTDKDALSDSFEIYLGTSKILKDTDKDGQSDFKEFQEGRNPLGPGLLPIRSSVSF